MGHGTQLTWSLLNDIERKILIRAGRNALLGELRSSWAPQVRDRRKEIDLTRATTEFLIEVGLVGVYEVADGYPDVPPDQVRKVLSAARFWDESRAAAARFGLCVTDKGECLLIDGHQGRPAGPLLISRG